MATPAPSLTLTNLNTSASAIAAAAGVKLPKLTGTNWAAELAALAGKVGAKGASSGGNPLWSRNPDRSDGWNMMWYGHVRPDVVAAGADLLAHWLQFGRFEGTLPYEGGKPWAPDPAHPHDFIFLGAPEIELPNVYAEPNATSVLIVGRLHRKGVAVERSYPLMLYTYNDNGGINIGGRQPEYDGSSTMPSEGSVFAIRMPLDPNWRGFFSLDLKTMGSHQAYAKARIYCNTPRPADYKVPAYPKAGAQPTCPKPAKWDFETDFLGDLWKDWRPSAGGDINHMRGGFVGPNERDAAGVLVDPYPIIEGARAFRPVNCRERRWTNRFGVLKDWGMPMLVRDNGFAFGVIQLDVTLPDHVPGLNFGWWGIADGGSWPPEWDHFEHTAQTTGQTIHGFPIGGGYDHKQQGGPLPYGGGRHLLTVERTKDTYRQFWYSYATKATRLVVEQSNYLEDRPMGTTLSIEGPGGDAAPFDDVNRDYSPFYMLLHGYRSART